MRNKLGTALLVAMTVAGWPLRALAADALYLPNLGANATGSVSGAKRLLDVNLSFPTSSGDAYAGATAGLLTLGVTNEANSTLGGANNVLVPLTVDSTGRLRVDATIIEAATAADGGALPALTKVISGYDGTNVQAVKTNSSGAVETTVASSVLPTGASTAANQTTANTSLSSIDTKTPALVSGRVPVDGSGVTQPISAAALPLPAGAATSAKQPALGTAGTASADVITVQGIASMTALKVDGSAVTQPVSAASLPLPTGAATSANQSTEITALNALSGTVDTPSAAIGSTGLLVGGQSGGAYHLLAVDASGVISANVTASVLPSNASTESTLSALSAKVANNFGVASGAVRTAAQVGNASGAADFGSGSTSAQTMRVVVASDQTLPTKAPVNTTGSGSAAGATVSTVVTLTAPANATGFILQNADISTANIRWAIGRTATVSLGQQLQPGRDTGFIPAGANVSLVAESGTQTYDIQWVSQ